MLKGIFTYGGHSYSLIGYDFGDSTSLYLYPENLEGRRQLDEGIELPSDDGNPVILAPMWDKIYLSVGTGFVKVSKFTETEGGKVCANMVNKEAFSRLGSIIAGMRLACVPKNRDDEIDLLTGFFMPKKVIRYTIGGLGNIDLRTKCLTYLDYKAPDGVSLSLEEDGVCDSQITTLTKTQHKIKLDLEEFSSYLGIAETGSWNTDASKPFSLSEIIERNPGKSYVWLKGRQYFIVKPNEVENICKEIWAHNGLVAFDTETTGLDISIKSRVGQGDRLVGLVFSIRSGQAWYFPIAHKNIENICTPVTENYTIEKYFRPILERKELLCFNGSFDWRVMHIYGIWCNLCQDAMILAKVTIWNDNRHLSLALKSLVSELLHRDSFVLSDFVEGKWGDSGITFSDLGYEETKYYACPDTDSLLDLFKFMMDSDFLGKYGAKKTYETEVAFSMAIGYQEFYGHCADLERIDGLVKDIDKGMSEAYFEMVQLAGQDFNPRSPKDLSAIVFNKLQYPIYGYTDTGTPGLGKPIREKYMSERKPDDSPRYPFINYLHEWKDYAQLKSNFTNNLDKMATEDGLMFSEVKQFLETGRVSVKEPNYQSYNDVVKKYIVPRDGFYAVDVDYSSIEYRILACMAGQKNLIENFIDPDMDYHTYQASRMFKIPYELVSKALRGNAKGINFGIPYGMGDKKLGARLFGSESYENTQKAKVMKRIYFEGQEFIEKFFIDARRDGVANCFSETYFGRRRYFDPRKTPKHKIERESGNNRIQGTAADIYKMGIVRLMNEIRKRDWVGKVLISAFIHDEAFIEVHKSIDPARAMQVIRKCLMLEVEGWCPLYIGFGYGRNWYEAKKTEIPVQVQQQIVDTWGETGLDWWDGDTARLYHWEVNMINNYRRDRVISYLKDENNWNKVLKPVENSLAHEVLSELKNGVEVDGVVDATVRPNKDMIENLKQFCIGFDLLALFEQANILKPVPQESNEVSVPIESGEMRSEEEELSPLEKMKMRLDLMGISSYKDGDVSRIYFKYVENPPYLELMSKAFKSVPGNIEVWTIKDGQEFKTDVTTSMVAYTKAMKIAMSLWGKVSK